jgi:hypothetical protein
MIFIENFSKTGGGFFDIKIISDFFKKYSLNGISEEELVHFANVSMAKISKIEGNRYLTLIYSNLMNGIEIKIEIIDNKVHVLEILEGE